MLTKLLILVLVAMASAQLTSVKRPYGHQHQHAQQMFHTAQQTAQQTFQQQPVPVPAPAPVPVPAPVPAPAPVPVPAPLPVPPPIVPPMIMGGGSPIIDLLLLGTLFGGGGFGGFGGFGGGRRGGRYGRDVESVEHETEALVNRFKRQYSQFGQQMASAQQQQIASTQQQQSVPVPVPAPVPAPLPVPPPIVPPIVPPMIMGGGSPIIDLLLLGTLFGGGGFGGFGGGRRGGRYGRDIEPIVHEAEALELEEPTSEHEVNVREKRQLGMLGAGLGVPPIGMPIAPVGGLGITGSPIIDLLVLGQLFGGGGDNYRGGRRHRHRDFKREVEELLQEAEALETEEPTSEHEVNEQVKTGERVERQLIGDGFLSPLSQTGGIPLSNGKRPQVNNDGLLSSLSSLEKRP
jgi:hypothetical protein